MPTSPPSRPDLQRAVDVANGAIRGFLRLLPGYCPQTDADRARLASLRDAYMAAVAARDAARGREAEDDPAPVLTAA